MYIQICIYMPLITDDKRDHEFEEEWRGVNGRVQKAEREGKMELIIISTKERLHSNH